MFTKISSRGFITTTGSALLALTFLAGCADPDHTVSQTTSQSTSPVSVKKVQEQPAALAALDGVRNAPMQLTVAKTRSAASVKVTTGGVVIDGPRVDTKDTLAKLRKNGSAASASAGVGAPAAIDLSGYSVPVGDQGQHSSCVGWAVGYGLVGWYAKKAGVQDPRFAAYYVYSQINKGRDAGSQPYDAFQIITTQGVAKLADYPQQTRDDNVFGKPTTAQIAKAKPFQMTGLHVIANGSNTGSQAPALFKQYLANQQPIAFSVYVTQELQYHMQDASIIDEVNQPVLTDASGNWSGHEILAVGYDAEGVYFQNSWGTQWGANGYGKLSWAWLSKFLTSAYTVDGFVSANPAPSPTPEPAPNSAPVVSAPTATPQLNSGAAANGTTRFVVKFSVKGAANRVQLDQSVDGGAWTVVSAGTDTSTVVDLVPGHTYRFASTARGTDGTWTEWSVSAPIRVSSWDENNQYMKYSGGWNLRDWSPAVGGQLAVTATPNAYATFTYSGTDLALVATRAANRGQFRVYVDNVDKGVVDLYSATTQARNVVLTVHTAKGVHTLTLVNIGTSGHPAMDIDNLLLAS